MILRRITEHVKAQNWFSVGLDFIIVVVGVFIGIQVSNWNDALADRSKETGTATGPSHNHGLEGETEKFGGGKKHNNPPPTCAGLFLPAYRQILSHQAS